MKIAVSTAVGQKKYFFVECDNKPVYLIYNEVLSVKKGHNLKRHPESKRLTIFKLVGVQKNEKLTNMTVNLKKQQNTINKGTTESVSNIKAILLAIQLRD